MYLGDFNVYNISLWKSGNNLVSSSKLKKWKYLKRFNVHRPQAIFFTLSSYIPSCSHGHDFVIGRNVCACLESSRKKLEEFWPRCFTHCRILPLDWEKIICSQIEYLRIFMHSLNKWHIIFMLNLRKFWTLTNKNVKRMGNVEVVKGHLISILLGTRCVCVWICSLFKELMLELCLHSGASCQLRWIQF